MVGGRVEVMVLSGGRRSRYDEEAAGTAALRVRSTMM